MDLATFSDLEILSHAILKSMSRETKEFPKIFEYNDYRVFLKDAYDAMKTLDKKFSFRYFARVAGFNSHNFLRLVIQGQSNLSLESIDKIAKAFKFNREESNFFKNLVLLNQSATSEEKQRYAREILRSQAYRKIHPLSESKYHMFANWFVTVVRELVALPKFKEDPAWIAKSIRPNIKPAEAEKAIDELLKLGLLKRDEDGKLIQSEPLLSTPDEVSSTYISNWHKEYIQRASESIDSFPREIRDISAVTFGFSEKNIKLIKEAISNFRKEIIRIASEQENKNVLMQLNIQLFPVAKTEDEDET